MATIKDVARLANVSVSTVSRVINDSGYVAKDAHDRVRSAMKELNYQPNAVARGLVSRKTNTIGLIIPDVANPFFSDIARGVEDEAIESGYTVIFCNTDWQTEREHMYIDLLKGKWAEGAILVGSRMPEDELLNKIKDLPAVLVDRKPVEMINSVWSDNELGGYIAAKHLMDIGCRRIAHISGPKDSPSALARKVGFLKALGEHPNIYGTVLQGDFRFDGGYSAATDLFSEKEFPDGIFAGNDMMAIGIIQAANQHGIRIPEDIKLVGYDNIAMAQYVYPALTTVEQPGQEMGREAFKILMSRLKGRKEKGYQKEFPAKLHIRNSTSSGAI